MSATKRQSSASASASAMPHNVRCAIYTRKSTEEGLQQEFNTLDAQRESGEAYIAAQKNEGWVCLPDRYDDGGFTGGNLERPAVKRLMADIEAGRIDCVVVYKVDRLSRSLMDFARMMQVFERHNVSFVSVTQQFNTTHSMGRLTLNILLSFAQFEREIISERTRDKIAAARRKGKWSGGKPLLGYDTLASVGGTKLIVNEDEALQIRSIFDLYLKHESLIPAVKEIANRGWTNKRWTTKAGKSIGGRPFDKVTLYQLLTNITYLGQVRYKTEVHAGEHAGIVDRGVFQRVQAVLQRNGRSGGALVRNKYGALLKGILHCGSCNCAMIHSYTAKANRRYRYYVCLNAQKRGWHTCPTKSVPAAEIERFVVDQIRGIGRDPAVAASAIKKARLQAQSSLTQLRAEHAATIRELKKLESELRNQTGQSDPARCADLQDRSRNAEQRLAQLQREIESVENDMVDEKNARESLAAFDPVWNTLSPKEQARLIRLLVSSVVYNAVSGKVAVTFRPGGLASMHQQLEAAA